MKFTTRVFLSLVTLLALVGLGQVAMASAVEPSNTMSIEKVTDIPAVHTASILLSDVGTAGDEEGNRGTVGGINWLLFFIGAMLVTVIVVLVDILNTVGEIQNKPVINWNSFNGILLLIFLVVGMIFAFWEFFVHGKETINAQDPASAHGEIYESMFIITLALTGVVFIITQILLFWYGYRYRYSEKRKALFYPDNHRLEFLWTIIPAVVLTILVVRGLKTWNEIMNHKDEKALNIEVFGYQFAWNVRYSGADKTLGSHDFRQMDVMNALGVDTNDTKSHDDVITNELHLPVGKPVTMNFRAKDVIHSAFLPHFRVQMNVVPGLPTRFSFTPVITTADMRERLKDPGFDYILLCNKICGSAHYRMKMKVVIDSPAEYKRWLKKQPTLVQKSETLETPAVSVTDDAQDDALAAK
jgi:cytochrome c oxidase subunit 2